MAATKNGYAPKETKIVEIRQPDKRFASGFVETGVYINGTVLRFGNTTKAFDVRKHPRWKELPKGQRRLIRRAAAAAGMRAFVAASLENAGQTASE
jgi:hypothetical protein